MITQEITKVEIFGRSGKAFITKTVREEVSTRHALNLIHESGVDEEVRVCANKNCGSEFTRQEGASKLGHYRKTGILYCSHLCAKATVQRALNARKKLERKASK